MLSRINDYRRTPMYPQRRGIGARDAGDQRFRSGSSVFFIGTYDLLSLSQNLLLSGRQYH